MTLITMTEIWKIRKVKNYYLIFFLFLNKRHKINKKNDMDDEVTALFKNHDTNERDEKG